MINRELRSQQNSNPSIHDNQKQNLDIDPESRMELLITLKPLIGLEMKVGGQCLLSNWTRYGLEFISSN